jgi:outer membrane protein assembly factor BamB
MINPHADDENRAKPTDMVCWCTALVIATVALASLIAQARAQWPQSGGPNRNFTVETSGLADKWPEGGPKKLCVRDLGEGYSAILEGAGRLYTMYRAGGKEIVISLDATTGETIWEHGYESALPTQHKDDYGTGPNATPLLTGGRLYSIGIAGMMHCRSADTGSVLWSHDLLTEFDGTILEYGYSSSPIDYKDTVIVLVGGKGRSIVAFNKNDGSITWENLDFANSYSTPQILEILGEEELVTYMQTEVIGADPTDGTLKWRYPITNRWKQNISLPIPAGDEMLFISSLRAGSRGLRLGRNAGRMEVEEVWSTRKIQKFFSTAVAIGDHVYTSTGRPGATSVVAVNMLTGSIAWRERGFGRANLLGADDRFIILDEGGDLILATATPDGLTVHSRITALEAPSWTAPTLVGTTLYMRDRKHIMALDLGRPAGD